MRDARVQHPSHHSRRGHSRRMWLLGRLRERCRQRQDHNGAILTVTNSHPCQCVTRLHQVQTPCTFLWAAASRRRVLLAAEEAVQLSQFLSRQQYQMKLRLRRASRRRVQPHPQWVFHSLSACLWNAAGSNPQEHAASPTAYLHTRQCQRHENQEPAPLRCRW